MTAKHKNPPSMLGVGRAVYALTGHALKEAYMAMPFDVQQRIAFYADKMVDDMATSTQDRAFLRGDADENRVYTDALFANALCALILSETA